jgi:hypothetical protein
VLFASSKALYTLWVVPCVLHDFSCHGVRTFGETRFVNLCFFPVHKQKMMKKRNPRNEMSDSMGDHTTNYFRRPACSAQDKKILSCSNSPPSHVPVKSISPSRNPVFGFFSQVPFVREPDSQHNSFDPMKEVSRWF